MKRLFDIFPAIIKIAPPDSLSVMTDLGIRGDVPKGTRRLDRCRAVCMDNTLMVAVDSPEGPKLVFREQITDHAQEGKTHWVTTESGKVIVLEKDQNCGCGSRLRVWNPYRNSISTSIEDPS